MSHIPQVSSESPGILAVWNDHVTVVNTNEDFRCPPIGHRATITKAKWFLYDRSFPGENLPTDKSNPTSAQLTPDSDSGTAEASSEASSNPEPAERRRHGRYAVTASAEVLDIQTRTRMIGRTNDLSLGGCYVDMGNALSVGTTVRLRLMAERRVFDTPARVVSAHAGMGMGLAFMKTAPDQEAVLRSWMDELAGQLSSADEMEFTLAQPSQANAPVSVRDIVDELVGMLRQKHVLEESEAQRLHQKLSE